MAFCFCTFFSSLDLKRKRVHQYHQGVFGITSTLGSFGLVKPLRARISGLPGGKKYQTEQKSPEQMGAVKLPSLRMEKEHPTYKDPDA